MTHLFGPFAIVYQRMPRVNIGYHFSHFDNIVLSAFVPSTFPLLESLLDEENASMARGNLSSMFPVVSSYCIIVFIHRMSDKFYDVR